MARRQWAALAAGWMLLAVVLSAWLSRTPGPALRNQLTVLQFWSLEACVALLAACLALVLRDILQALGKEDALKIAVLVAAALVLTLFVAPRTNRIYYDEHIYQGIGQNLSDLRLAQMCNDGNVEYGRLQCTSGEYNKQPYAYPHLLSVVYRLFGVHDRWAFAVNALAMALTVASVYLLVLLLFADRRAAFFAGAVMTLLPQQIMWSATAAVEPTASLACVIALLCAAQFVRARSTVALLAAGVSAAYALQFRPESFLVLVPLACLVLLRAPTELHGVRLWWIGLLVAALLAVHVGHMFAVRDEGWGTTEDRLSLGYVARNLRVNFWFYLADERFPAVFTFLAVAGAASRRFLAERLAIVLYFLAFFTIFLLFYAGSYNYGADVRYSLMTYPPIAMLGGLGLARLAGWLTRFRPRRGTEAVLTAALIFQFLWYVPLVRATTEEAWAARADVRFAREVAADLPANSYVLAHNPAMFHLWGVSAGQMSRVANDRGHLAYLTSRYAGGVYLHWNFWCNVLDPVQQAFCRQAIAQQPVELVREYRERDQRYAFYRVMPVPLHPE